VFFNTSLLDQHLHSFIAVVYYLWKTNIRFLQNQQVGETVRELGLAGQNEKAGTLLWEV
jgi:hypothetical protein